MTANLFNSTVLPTILYSSETWAATKNAYGIEGYGKIHAGNIIRSEVIQEQSGVKNMITEHQKHRFRRVGRFARFTDNRWTRVVVVWYPRDWKRRWKDETAKPFREKGDNKNKWMELGNPIKIVLMYDHWVKRHVTQDRYKEGTPQELPEVKLSIYRFWLHLSISHD